MRDEQTPTLRDYLRVIWRRRWIVLVVALLGTAGTVALSDREKPVYEASAQVLLSNQNLAATLTGVPATNQDPVRLAQTQADLARVPTVAARTIAAAHVSGLTPAGLLAASSVTPASDADMLEFSVRDGDPALAERLATAYAREYTTYRRQVDTAAIQRALAEAQQHLRQLRRNGDTASPLYAGLTDKVQTLQIMEALQTSNAYVVRTASDASQVSPKTVRNGLLALGVGLILGLGFALLRETLDSRIRSADEIADALDLPLLARVPRPSRRLSSQHKLVSLAEPASPSAEAFRKLRTNLDFANPDVGIRSILITSAVQQEGKSTIAANLAVALARAGRSVVLVDLDLRRPFLHRFFDLDLSAGLTTVARGHASLDEVLCPIAVGGDMRPAEEAASAAERYGGRASGLLEVLPAGPLPPDPGEFVETSSVTTLLAELRERASVVIIDGPPLLTVGDALTLSAYVDGIVVVTRLATLRRPVLRELRRALDVTPAVKLGFVLAGAEVEEGYGVAGYYAYAGRKAHDADQRVD